VNQQPGPYPQPTATPAGHALRNAAINHQADQLMAAINGITPTQHAEARPMVTIGTTPPVTDQPGARRAPMSQRAVDLNATILSASVLTAVLGGAVTGVLWASDHANPTVIAWVCACVVAVPAALALPVLALKGLMKSAKEVVEAAPPTIHNHYSGQITQTTNTIQADTRGLIAITRNELPPAR